MLFGTLASRQPRPEPAIFTATLQRLDKPLRFMCTFLGCLQKSLTRFPQVFCEGPRSEDHRQSRNHDTAGIVGQRGMLWLLGFSTIAIALLVCPAARYSPALSSGCNAAYPWIGRSDAVRTCT